MISKVLIDAMAAVRDYTSRLITRAGGTAAGATGKFAGTSEQVAHKYGAADSEIHDDIDLTEFEPNHEVSGRPKTDTTVFSSPVHGRDLIDELDYRILSAEALRGGRHDLASTEIYRLQGFDGLPTLTNWENIDGLVHAGEVRLLRGVSDASHVAEFKSGSYFPGTGDFGNGTYATTDPQRALRYAGDDLDKVIEMVLHPDANIVSYEDLYNEQQKALTPLNNELNRLHKMDRTPAEDAQYEELKDQKFILSDRGRFAAIKGYDAYRAPDATNEEWVILNRTALIIRE